ncbi:MAG: hypothetical protein GX303_03285, partial [Clostridiales bacterium]|nr:hypothetical protein [Clostridiales bacterium]
MMNRARQLIGLPFFITAFICIILTFAPVQVSATYDDISDNSNDIAAQSQAYIDIYNALSDSVPEINVLEHNISINDLGDLYFQVILENPELFYVVTAAEYTYNTNNIVVDIIPQYSMSGSDLATAKQTYASELYKIVAGVPEGLTDLEKVLYINSYFSVNFSYDTRQENTIYDAYGLFTQKVGVCQAYSAAFIAVMQELSIPVSYAVTVDDPPAGGDGHMWNLVKINDHWYHIDLTWNDPVSDMPGRSVYYYFLLSDIAMGEFHSEWISSYECTDTTYDNYFWRNVKAPFIYSEGSWYYINNDDFKIYRYNFATGNREVILKIKGRWPIIG